jgi:hypothetical protein
MIRWFCGSLGLTLTVSIVLVSPLAAQQNQPATTEGDFTVKNFKFQSGKSLPELRLHYAPAQSTQIPASNLTKSSPSTPQTITENLIRNDRVHVSRITHAPQQHVRMHYAPPLTEVFLTDAHYILIWSDGNREEHSHKAGDAAWFPGGLHASESLDDHEQQIMIVVPVSDPNPERAEGDPFIGRFVPVAEPRTGTRSLSFAREGDWQIGSLRVATNSGEERTFTYRAKFDGEDYPYTEPANLLNTVSLHRVDRSAFVMTEKRDGKVVAIYTRVLSEDRKTLTNCRYEPVAQGQEMTKIEVLQRQ